MKLRIFVFALVAIALCASAIGQTVQNSGDWVGIWHAESDGLPTGWLTLAADSGTLGGTVVLDIVGREGGHPRVIAQDPHVLMNPHVDGKSLSFDVRMRKRDGSIVTASFVVTRTSSEKASIHCVSCGADAPIVELARER